MIPTAYVCHESAGRLRLRVPSMRGDSDYFRAVEERLSGGFGVVTSNSATGSILLRHQALSARSVGVAAAREGLFAVDSRPARGGDHQLASDPMRWQAALAAVFLMLSVFQLSRGRVLAPAATMLWHALEAMRWAKGKS